jgi:hypothetical protein
MTGTLQVQPPVTAGLAMSTDTRHHSTAFAACIMAAAATSTLLLGALPASAQPVPEPDNQVVSVWTCPTRIGSVAQVLRAERFTAQAAHNIAVSIRADCTAGH